MTELTLSEQCRMAGRVAQAAGRHVGKVIMRLPSTGGKVLKMLT
jgi:hypothetical protein